MHAALDELADAAAHFIIEGGDSQAVVMAAANALAAGFDSTRLRELAGEPVTDVPSEIEGLIGAALREVGLPAPAPGDASTLDRLLRLQCEEYLDGKMTAYALTRWVSGYFSEVWDGPIGGLNLLRFNMEDQFDLKYEYTGGTQDEMAAEVTVLATQVLASYPRE